MAMITIMISDDISEDGADVAIADFKVDYEGAPAGTPPTMAVMFGATIQRLGGRVRWRRSCR